MAITRACYQCTERHLGCHDRCQQYLDEKAKRDKLLDARYRYIENRYLLEYSKIKNRTGKSSGAVVRNYLSD